MHLMHDTCLCALFSQMGGGSGQVRAGRQDAREENSTTSNGCVALDSTTHRHTHTRTHENHTHKHNSDELKILSKGSRINLSCCKHSRNFNQHDPITHISSYYETIRDPLTWSEYE